MAPLEWGKSFLLNLDKKGPDSHPMQTKTSIAAKGAQALIPTL
jgi:hypothetical protein